MSWMLIARDFSTLVGWVGDALALAGLFYAALRLVSGWRLKRSVAPPGQSTGLSTRPPTRPSPKISVLKPLHGAEPQQYENLRSFFTQDYPEYQLVFGVKQADDPALAVVARLRAEFPQREVSVMINSRTHGSNPKVSNLINLYTAARYDWLVIADADIHAPPHYLRQLASEMAPEDVGIVTCLYHGQPEANHCSQLGRLFIDDWFAPSVRVAAMLGTNNYAFGATIALRRTVLQAIGGFEALANQLADDWWLGEYVRQLGLKTVLSACEVGTLVHEPSWQALLDHEHRWMRTIRLVQPAGYALMFISFTAPTVILGAVLGSVLAHWVAAAALVLRVAGFYQAQRLAGVSPHPIRDFFAGIWLLPQRDLLMVWAWLRGFSTRQVRWSGQMLSADQHSRVQAAQATLSQLSSREPAPYANPAQVE